MGPRRAQGPSLSSWQTLLPVVSSSVGIKDTPHLWNQGEVQQHINDRHETSQRRGLELGLQGGQARTGKSKDILAVRRGNGWEVGRR